MGQTFVKKENSEVADSLTDQNGPLCLATNVKNKLVINPQALHFLSQINENFGVVVVVGPYRQGKSFLLNQIMGRMNGFGVGHKDTSHTKGVWMWPELVEITRENGDIIKVLLLDTEVNEYL